MSQYVVVGKTLYQAQYVMPVESGVLDSITVYCSDDAISGSYSVDIMINIFNSSKVYSNIRYGQVNINQYSDWAWRTWYKYGAGSGYVMTAGTPFYILFTGSSTGDYYRMKVGYISGYPNNRKYSTTFAIPAVLNQDGYHCMNFTYTPDTPPPTGPALKIEGTTPGKLEYTSWSSINTVR
jgi:hypothetical protein